MDKRNIRKCCDKRLKTSELCCVNQSKELYIYREYKREYYDNQCKCCYKNEHTIDLQDVEDYKTCELLKYIVDLRQYNIFLLESRDYKKEQEVKQISLTENPNTKDILKELKFIKQRNIELKNVNDDRKKYINKLKVENKNLTSKNTQLNTKNNTNVIIQTYENISRHVYNLPIFKYMTNMFTNTDRVEHYVNLFFKIKDHRNRLCHPEPSRLKDEDVIDILDKYDQEC